MSRGRGLSMLELLVGVVIFTFAMLPILSFGTATTRGTYNVGKHLMAGQVASGLMDQLLAQPYEQSLDVAKTMKGKGKIPLMSDEMLKNVVGQLKDAAIKGEMEKDLARSFQSFSYEVAIQEASGNDKDQLFVITIRVYWKIQEGSAEEQSLMLSAIKYREQ